MNTVVWWAAGRAAPRLLQALRDQGVELLEDDRAIHALRAQVRVAPLPAGEPGAAQLPEALGLHVPTLWLADDAAAAAAWMPALPASDDAAPAGDDPALLLARLRRTAQRLQALDKALNRDPLTGLPNRRWLGGALRRALEAWLPGDVLALVLIDIDHFKLINDQHGHPAGDQVLAALGRWLHQRLPPDTPVARIGGEEFAVVLQGGETREVVREAEALIAELGRTLVVPGTGVFVTASAGLAFARPRLSEPEWMEQADAALYDAKLQGRNRVFHHELIGANRDDAEDELARFRELTRHTAERMSRMVDTLSRRLLDAAEDRSLRDALTGLRNRGFLDRRLPQELQRAHRRGTPLALVLLDLDHFHDVNERFNYTSGDAVLRQFAALAAGLLRAGDWLARYGGEEFALVMPGTALDEAAAVAERLRAAVAAARFVADDGDTPVPLTVSVGVAMQDDDTPDAVALCKKAGAATLQAKRQGRNRVVVAR